MTPSIGQTPAPQQRAAEDEVLGALDETQRETLYNLLHQAAGSVVTCPTLIDD